MTSQICPIPFRIRGERVAPGSRAFPQLRNRSDNDLTHAIENIPQSGGVIFLPLKNAEGAFAERNNEREIFAIDSMCRIGWVKILRSWADRRGCQNVAHQISSRESVEFNRRPNPSLIMEHWLRIYHVCVFRCGGGKKSPREEAFTEKNNEREIFAIGRMCRIG